MDGQYDFGAGEFAAMARALMIANGRPSDAAVLAGNTRAGAILKAAAAAGTATLSNPAWAAELVQYKIVANSFIESLRNIGVFDRLAASGMKIVPVGSRVVISTVAIAGSNPAEIAPKAITQLALTGADIEPAKASCILVVSDEIARSTTAGGMALLSTELRNGVVAATDSLFLGLMLGEAPIASAGSDAAAVAADIGALLGAVSSGSSSALFLIVPPIRAKKLATMVGTDGRAAFPEMTPSGGSLFGIPTLVSDGLAADAAVLIDAAQVVADPGTVTLDASNQASLVMDSAPTGAMAAAFSLWQTNNRALRAERFFGFQAAPGGVAVLQPCEWGEA